MPPGPADDSNNENRVVVRLLGQPEMVAARARFLATRDMHCGACRYNLRGSKGDICPECGAAVTFSPMSELIQDEEEIAAIERTRAFLAVTELSCKHCKTSLRGTDGQCSGCGVIYRVLETVRPKGGTAKPAEANGCFELLLLLISAIGMLVFVWKLAGFGGHGGGPARWLVGGAMVPWVLLIAAFLLRPRLRSMSRATGGVVLFVMLMLAIGGVALGAVAP